MPELREFCETVLRDLAAPTFFLSAQDTPPTTAYIWKIITSGENQVLAGKIEMKPREYLPLNTKTDSEKREYLRERFSPYFDQLRRDLGLR